MKNLFKSISLLTVLISTNLFAGVATVACLAGGQELKVNNEAVLNWKTSTHNQYRNRAHISGNLLYVYPDHSGHHHYQVQIGANNKDTIEVIYNEAFGAIPEIAVGSQFEACGDYITSNAPAGGFPASPDGAIVHWVHQSPNTAKHDSGFLVINNVTYGMDAGHAGPKPGKGSGKQPRN